MFFIITCLLYTYFEVYFGAITTMLTQYTLLLVDVLKQDFLLGEKKKAMHQFNEF